MAKGRVLTQQRRPGRRSWPNSQASRSPCGTIASHAPRPTLTTPDPCGQTLPPKCARRHAYLRRHRGRCPPHTGRLEHLAGLPPLSLVVDPASSGTGAGTLGALSPLRTGWIRLSAAHHIAETSTIAAAGLLAIQLRNILAVPTRPGQPTP